MIYKSIDIMEFPKTGKAYRFLEKFNGTKFEITEKSNCIELRAENWHEITLEGDDDERA